MPKVRLDNIPLYYEERGSGLPLLLVMGLGGNLDWWGSGFLDALATRYRVITFDNRDAGRTGVQQTDYTLADMARDTMNLLDFLDISRACIFGASMGGMIVQEIALTYPERVTGIILGCTNCGGKHAAYPESDILQKLVNRGSSMAEIKKNLAFLLFPGEFLDRYSEIIESSWDEMMKIPMSEECYQRQLRAVQRFESCGRLSDLNAPTLIIHGTADVLVPVENAEIMASKIPNANVQLIEGVGHGLFAQAPGEVLHAINSFIGSL